ncbi:SDR family oxidoreductase [Cytophagales bacterium LB-30]|uniref:SDR family oxidoreductase n=1 Tax=Shiella aurantiaca TaxID=3058365 RepID=A0ABT8F5V8_9BACT|nr:SDR family oxidoreductase [Shiella aurantiaca]MDN4165611.1 SDR family oxidoreductase [Shiella aurantiaca]
MPIDLSGKTALVCGSTQGIGLATALEMAKLNARVILMARNESKLKELVQALAGKGHAYLVADFSKPEEVKKAIEDFISQGNTIDILVNNTGGPAAGPALTATAEQFLSAFQSHLICNQYLVQAVQPGMKNKGYGRIINVISTSVKVPIFGLGVSNTIRGAVANWAKTLSLELAPFGITVNNVLPGATKTGRLEAIISNKAEKNQKALEEVSEEMLAEIPAKRFAQPEEVGYAICFLASPAAGYINGTNLPVDGGRTGSL